MTCNVRVGPGSRVPPSVRGRRSIGGSGPASFEGGARFGVSSREPHAHRPVSASLAEAQTNDSTSSLRSILLRLAAAVVAACCAQVSFAQPTPPVDRRMVQESWAFKDGAPEVATALAQTSDGSLWVGSPAGLFRFDGVRFELFRSPFGDSLYSTNVSALLAVGDGLWVGYEFGGFSFVKHGKVTNFAVPTATVNGFARDQGGMVWAGEAAATRAGLWRYDGSTWQGVGPEWGLPAGVVAQVGFDREGVLWVLMGLQGPEMPKQLYSLAPGEQRFRTAAADLHVQGFTRDADGTVLTTSLPPRRPILRKNAEEIVDRANDVWVISSEAAVFRRASSGSLEDVVASVSPANAQVIAINPLDHAALVDREGATWFGTPDGVHRFSESPLARLQVPAATAPFFMLAPDDGGAAWVTAGDGVGKSTLYRVSDGRVDRGKSIPGVSSFAYRAPDKSYWFGGESGLWHRVDGRLEEVAVPKEQAERVRQLVTMTHDGAGGFWVSFAGLGLYRLKDGTWSKFQGGPRAPGTRRPCAVTAVLSAFTDRANRVWLGCTKNQVALFDGDQKKFFSTGDGLQVGNVTAIHGRGLAIWVGGEFGLQQFDEGRLRTLLATDPEALRGISGIVETADGDLWLNGLGGIVHVRRDEIARGLADPAYRVATERYDRRWGLPGLPAQLRRGPTAIEGTDGKLWFTVSHGVVWVDPSRIEAKRIPSPPVSIQSITVDERMLELEGLAPFPAGTSNVAFRYGAVSLRAPEAIRFRYRLHGLDRDWHVAAPGSRSVSYRTLPHGTYRFEVNASDINGAWSDPIASAEFTILPAYYQTSWFRAACALLLLLLAWVGYQLHIRRLQRRFEMTLEARVAERTRIARDLHDTLLQSFQGLLLRFQAALNLLPDRPAEAKRELAGAIGHGAAAITEGRDAVQGLRSSTLESNDLADSLRALAEDLASENRDSAMQMDVQGLPRTLHPLVRDEVFRIAGEALRNAFRHAGARHIEVELHYDTRHLRVRVRDDGKGIDPAVLHAEGPEGHFGLRGMRERAKVAGGKLSVWTSAGAGTEVELTIPGPYAYGGASSARPWFGRKLFGQRETIDP